MSCSRVIVHCPVEIAVIMIAIIMIMDAVAWMRKYFVAASVDRGFLLFIRMGMMANMLISKPIHINNQCELIKVIIVPENRVR